MAGNSRIVATVKAITTYTGIPDTNAQFLVQYHCTGPVNGQVDGEALLEVDVTQTDAQIQLDLRAALAAHVDPLVDPPQSYSGTDVRGLSI